MKILVLFLSLFSLNAYASIDNVNVKCTLPDGRVAELYDSRMLTIGDLIASKNVELSTTYDVPDSIYIDDKISVKVGNSHFIFTKYNCARLPGQAHELTVLENNRQVFSFSCKEKCEDF